MTYVVQRCHRESPTSYFARESFLRALGTPAQKNVTPECNPSAESYGRVGAHFVRKQSCCNPRTDARRPTGTHTKGLRGDFNRYGIGQCKDLNLDQCLPEPVPNWLLPASSQCWWQWEIGEVLSLGPLFATGQEKVLKKRPDIQADPVWRRGGRASIPFVTWL